MKNFFKLNSLFGWETSLKLQQTLRNFGAVLHSICQRLILLSMLLSWLKNNLNVTTTKLTRLWLVWQEKYLLKLLQRKQPH